MTQQARFPDRAGKRLATLLGTVLEGVDHIGVAVRDLDSALAFYRDSLGLPVIHRETVAEQGVEGVLLAAGDEHVELLRPLFGESVIGRFLDRQGPGLHHVAYRVDDIESELDRLRSAGVRLIDHQPKPGIRGSRVAFLNPRSSAGALTELVEGAR
jgi:methylmalonyl-CoA/ethylmalonyl-CoA epimerase